MINITARHGRVYLESPYHPDLPRPAKKLGGKWDPVAKQWHFDTRDEARVRELCRDVYGTDGSDTRRVTVRAALCEGDSYECALYACGRQIARVFGRDSGAKLGDDVVVLSGGFGSSGSRKNPKIVCREDTVIELRDLPQEVVEQAFADGDFGDLVQSVEIVTAAEEAQVDQEALKAERARLLDRIAEIDSALGNAAKERPRSRFQAPDLDL